MVTAVRPGYTIDLTNYIINYLLLFTIQDLTPFTCLLT